MPPRRETDDLTDSLDTGVPSQALRTKARQELLRASRRDCNKSRDRFIPRPSLAEIIDADLVECLLQTIPGKCKEDASHRKSVVQMICPVPGKCSCDRKHCLGRRMILATLLLYGREDLIHLFLLPESPQTCDSDLPFRFSLPGVPNYGLKQDEQELFYHYQWQVYTPFLTCITLAEGNRGVSFPEEVSLPWMRKTEMGKQEPGEVSYVEIIEIHPGSHDLDKTNVFALKTFEKSLAPEVSASRFRQEVDANLKVHKHDRIVPLLTAFSYRERFYLVFPLATEGSLEKLWRAYTPERVARGLASARIADWYSDEWLIAECLGISEALLATHCSIDGDSAETNGLIHADIKPENVLCFLKKSDDGKKSITLKLADFGEAKRAKPDLTASNVAHVMTYRPPEHVPGNTITLKYDVWCLGCLFLDFVIWVLSGHQGVESFAEDRAEEPDDAAVSENPGQIIEDTFFKRVKQEPTPFILKRLHWKPNKEIKRCSGRAMTTYSLSIASHVVITSRLKDAVIERLASSEEDENCGNQLKQFLLFIRDRMLVVDPLKRASSREVRDYLKSCDEC